MKIYSGHYLVKRMPFFSLLHYTIRFRINIKIYNCICSEGKIKNKKILISAIYSRDLKGYYYLYASLYLLWLMVIIFTVWKIYTYYFSSQKSKLFRSNLREEMLIEVMRKKQFQELKDHLPYKFIHIGTHSSKFYNLYSLCGYFLRVP